jgi:hypothetical protein
MLTTKPLAFFKTDPKQPRKQFTEADLRSLGASLKTLGQFQPVGTRLDGTLLWGRSVRLGRRLAPFRRNHQRPRAVRASSSARTLAR